MIAGARLPWQGRKAWLSKKLTGVEFLKARCNEAGEKTGTYLET